MTANTVIGKKNLDYNDMRKIYQVTTLLLCTAFNAICQDIYWVMPRESQKATVTQRIGVTDISVAYHRPNVNGREVWGKLVPYEQVWRAGSNEATVFSTTTDILIENQTLPAGTYSLFFIPHADKWTVIFNKVAEQWGAFTYNAAQDQLRINDIKPIVDNHQETLLYAFPEVQDSTCKMTIRWEKVRVELNIKVDLLRSVQMEVHKNFTWRSAWFAADYYYQNLKNYTEALKWANASIALEETGGNLALKARILKASGNNKEALEYAVKARDLLTKARFPTAGIEEFIKNLQE
ncbi:MAG: DUF2911 domain-containing protein [Cyclobacteriaceae bacterium]|nr:DUF2911 domain-containing protein [Cyclobacteriaceae bacterium]